MVADTIITYSGMGAIFGLTAGLSPGPLLTLVISETLHHNRSEGIKVATAPLITDIPIILLTFFVLSGFAQFNIVLSLISITGGFFVAFLGYETLKTKELTIETQNIKPGSIKKAVIANFLNPHPYLFWLTVGTPIAFKAFETSLLSLILFFFSFYLMLIGSKIGVAMMVNKSKAFIKNKTYKWIMRILGYTLLVFAMFFIYDGFKTLVNLN